MWIVKLCSDKILQFQCQPVLTQVERKGKEEYLYSTILYTMYISKHSGMDHTVLCANTPCLSFVSVHQMAPPLTLVEDIQLQLTTHLSTRRDERLSWPGWLTYSGRFTHISGHPSATGWVQDGESSPAKDWRSTAVPHVTCIMAMKWLCGELNLWFFNKSCMVYYHFKWNRWQLLYFIYFYAEVMFALRKRITIEVGRNRQAVAGWETVAGARVEASRGRIWEEVGKRESRRAAGAATWKSRSTASSSGISNICRCIVVSLFMYMYVWC